MGSLGSHLSVLQNSFSYSFPTPSPCFTLPSYTCFFAVSWIHKPQDLCAWCLFCLVNFFFKITALDIYLDNIIIVKLCPDYIIYCTLPSVTSALHSLSPSLLFLCSSFIFWNSVGFTYLPPHSPPNPLECKLYVGRDFHICFSLLHPYCLLQNLTLHGYLSIY